MRISTPTSSAPNEPDISQEPVQAVKPRRPHRKRVRSPMDEPVPQVEGASSSQVPRIAGLDMDDPSDQELKDALDMFADKEATATSREMVSRYRSRGEMKTNRGSANKSRESSVK